MRSQSGYVSEKVFIRMTEDRKRCGVLYIATGSRYLAEAEHSVRSVKRMSPDVPVAIISDHLPSCDLFDVRQELPNPEYSFIDKIAALTRTPFERTLFLDTDTFAIAPLDEIF